MNVFSMAWRNVWRNSRRSIVTIAAMTFGLWVMVLYSGLLEGMMGGMERDLLDVEVGDIQVRAEGYSDEPSIYMQIEQPWEVVELLEARGLKATARLQAGGLAASGEQSSGVMLMGLHPTRDGEALKLDERVARGDWLSAEDPDGVVLGWRLAKTLGVDVGGELLVLTQGADGSMANELFEVRGVLGSISGGTDRGSVLMVDESFRTLLVVPTGAHQVIVRVPETILLADAKASVEQVLPGAEIHTWRELMPTIAQMMDATAGMMVFVYGIVYIAIGILILNAMLMVVFERIREFGVMKAIGVSPGMVLRLIVVETGVLLGIAAAAGLVLAAPSTWYLAHHGLDLSAFMGNTDMMGMQLPNVWIGVYGPAQFLGPLVAMSVIVMMAIVYPAVKAARISPVEAMRYQG